MKRRCIALMLAAVTMFCNSGVTYAMGITESTYFEEKQDVETVDESEEGDATEVSANALELLSVDESETANSVGEIEWNYDEETHVLTISGTGKMPDYAWEAAPWNDYRSEIIQVIIEDGVIGIGNYAFSNCDNLTNVEIPSKVERIGEKAFVSCDNLEKVVLGEGVKEIGQYAFDSNFKLTDLEVRGNIESIGNDAFLEHTIKRLYVGREVTDLDDTLYSFYNLEEIVVEEGNSSYQSDNGVLYNKGKTELIRCPRGKADITEYQIVESVTEIRDYAFYDCHSLTNVEISSKVKRIGKYAFAQCDKLGKVVLGEGVKELGERAFESCGNLAVLEIHSNIENIDSNTFGVTTALKRLYVGKEVTKLDDDLYSFITILEEIVVEEGNSSYESDSGVLYNKGKTELIRYPRRKADITEYQIAESVTEIREYAFDGCGNLESVIIPPNLKNIGRGVFLRCDNLKWILIPKSVTFIGRNAFYNCDELTIYGYANSYAQTYATDNNIPFVVLDDEPEETGRGFDLKQDGHCVVNDSLSFSYDGWTNWFGIFGYKIPLERYQEVYGESYTKHIYKQNISEWGGNCFGMSVTAAMFYKDKLPLLDYTHDVNILTAGGYDDMAKTVDGKYFLRLDNDSELTKLIERYQIWQDSDEFYKSRTKDILNYQLGTDAEAFSNIVSSVKSTKEPYLVIVRWEDAEGNHGHALVIDSARKPEDLGNGWVRLYLYDPNYPYFEYFNDKTPVSNYGQAENRFLDVNIQNGQWRMESGINGSQTDGTSIGYDDAGNLLKESQIYFVDVNDYPTNFDVKATFSASGELTAIAYMSDDFKVYDSDNVLIYQKEDGKTVFSEEDIVSEYVPCSYVEGMSDGISEGRLILPKGTYRVTVSEGAIAFLEDGDYAGIVSKEEVSIINEDSTSLSISSASGADVNVVIEDTYSDDNFTSIETDIEMDEKGCELSLDGSKLDIQKGTAQELDIDVITEDQEKMIEQISSDDVVDFDLISGICELLGDLNADGRVNITDLMMCLHHVSGRTQLSEERISVADIDGNGSVNITDLMRMLHYVSGRTEAL